MPRQSIFANAAATANTSANILSQQQVVAIRNARKTGTQSKPINLQP